MGRSDRGGSKAAAAQPAHDGGDAAVAKGAQSSGRRSPMHNVPTPSRGGRGGGERSRGAASALEDLMKRKGVDEAWNALEDMQRQGVATDKYTVSRMLMKTVGDGRVRLNPARVYRSIGLVERFIEQQPKDVDEVLFNALLDTCCRLKDLGRLESTVARMKALQVTPSPVTLGILVKTYGQAGDLQKVLTVWDEMETQRRQANAVTYGCMIDACVKCGHMAKAVEIFKGMREAGKHRNTILYTTLIKGYGLEKDLPSALHLFREMPTEGVPYNTITYNSMLDACIKCGDLPTAEGLLREMKAPESTLEPDLITFSTLLKGYCNVGDLDRALQVAEAIKANNLRCDELVYNTLMDGCVKASDVSAGIGLFEEMVQNGMQPSAITHSILTRLYQRAGYEDDASEAVAQLYQHHGVERPVAGDRGKGARRRGERMGSHSQSYNQSPASSCSNGGWSVRSNGLRISAFDCFDPSAPSTPAGSPLGSPARQAMHPCLPLETLGAPFIPAMPGAGCGDTPHHAGALAAFGGFTMPMGGSCTPVGAMMHGSHAGSMAGSLAGSPCGSPHGRPEPAFFAMSHPMQPGFSPTGAQAMMHSMPAWPGAFGGAPGAPGAMPPTGPPQCPPMATMNSDGTMQQVIAVPMMSPDSACPAMSPVNSGVMGGPVDQFSHGMRNGPGEVMGMPMHHQMHMPFPQQDAAAGGLPGQQQQQQQQQQHAYFAGWVCGDQQAF